MEYILIDQQIKDKLFSVFHLQIVHETMLPKINNNLFYEKFEVLFLFTWRRFLFSIIHDNFAVWLTYVIISSCVEIIFASVLVANVSST